MEDKPHIPEAVLARIWREQRFWPDRLKTTAGTLVQVVRPGQQNPDSGPDFKQALLRMGDHTIEGDVELHLEVGDWYAHGHHEDPNYNRTILHVVLWEPGQANHTHPKYPAIVKANGETVPTLIVHQSLTASLPTLLEYFQCADRQEHQKFLDCEASLENIADEHLLNQLRSLGSVRLYERARRFEQWLPAAHAVPSDSQDNHVQQLLYEAICEGLGYSANKDPFVLLARRLPLQQLIAHLPLNRSSTPSECLFWIQALLFGLSGLLPSANQLAEQSGSKKSKPLSHVTSGDLEPETHAYLSQLRSLWEMLLPCLDVMPMEPQDWHFFRLRPANFPTRRIAALTYLVLNYTVQVPLDHYLHLFALYAEHPDQISRHIRLFERTLDLPVTDYWQGRYLFGPPGMDSQDHRFLGVSRIRDILISAVFPVLLLYARYTSSATLETHILTFYKHFPSPQWNRRTKELCARLFPSKKLSKRAARTADLYQGLLHLDKHYCSQPACIDCPLLN